MGCIDIRLRQGIAMMMAKEFDDYVECMNETMGDPGGH